MLKANFEKQEVEKVYARLAPVYDLVFGSVFERGRKAVVAAAERVGGRILEAGVGTGISLPYYSGKCRISGIDLSEQMLEQARRKVKEQNLHHVEQLAIMDAENLEYPDESFDVVCAVCVVNTVPNPDRVLEEFARVLKPGGEIILLNRIGAAGGTRRAVERFFMPVTSKLGWRSDFPWDHFAKWLDTSAHEMQLIDRTPMPPFGHFSVIRFGKAAARVAAGQDAVLVK
ncbi:MAG: methyltransferase domain-containing protein [Chthoniobacteraceae bacterium]